MINIKQTNIKQTHIIQAKQNKAMAISNREQRFIEAASNEAAKSDILMRHGCVAVANGKIMGRGYNHRRSTSKDHFIKNTCTCHAEIATLRGIYKSYCGSGRGKYTDSIKGARE